MSVKPYTISSGGSCCVDNDSDQAKDAEDKVNVILKNLRILNGLDVCGWMFF